VDKKKINLLYITPLWSGMLNFFMHGNDEFSGMPGFNIIFKRVLGAPEIATVHVILFVDRRRNKGKIQVREKYNKLNVYPVFYNSQFTLLLQFIRWYFKGKILLKRKKIDVIYGHGSVGALGGLIRKSNVTRFVQRIYGTFLNNQIGRSLVALFLSHPLEYISFSQKADAVFITNDGTHGDRVFEKINGNRTNMHFLINGVYKEMVMEPLDEDLPEKYICYTARVDFWKRQHLLIEALGKLKSMGYEIPVYIAGPVVSQAYQKELEALTTKLKLGDQIRFLGALSGPKANFLLANSRFTLSLYHTSNLGNIFLESLTLGTPIIAINCNSSLESIPFDTFYKIDSEDPEDIAQAMLTLWNDDERVSSLAEKSRKFAQDKLLDWEQRLEQEYSLLTD